MDVHRHDGSVIPGENLISNIVEEVAHVIVAGHGHHTPTRQSLDNVRSAAKKGQEVSAVGQLSKQVKRVSLDMARRKSNDGADAAKETNFRPSHGLTTAEAEVLLQQWGRNELVEKVVPTWLIILRLVRTHCSCHVQTFTDPYNSS